MVTSAPNLKTTEDVINQIPENDFEYYDYLSKEEIRQGHVCECENSSLSRGTPPFYSMDKTEIVVCENCDGYFARVKPNH